MAWPEMNLIAQTRKSSSGTVLPSAQKVTMISRGDSPSVSAICAHVKHLGYATSRHIRVYGEKFEVVFRNPFPEADKIAVM
jgi:hypothetical protein